MPAQIDTPSHYASTGHAVVQQRYLDTDPKAIGTPGSPPVVAAPAQSMYQVDALALRCILGVSYGLRAPGAVAVLSGVTW